MGMIRVCNRDARHIYFIFNVIIYFEIFMENKIE